MASSGNTSSPVVLAATSHSSENLENVSQAEREFFQTYEIFEEVGRGGCSVVKLGKHKGTGEKVAVKIIQKRDGQKEDLGQAEILKFVDQPNIIALRDYLDTPTEIYLVMELATGGDIIDRIDRFGHYSEQDAVVFARKILLALAHCHKRGIVHCDLKLDNILLSSNDETSEVKIADFGFAQLVPYNAKLVEACGTPEYVAPEVLTGSGYDTAADMWSFGVILYILLSGVYPFFSNIKERSQYLNTLYEKIKRCEYHFFPKYWQHISAQAKDLIACCLRLNPTQRYTAEQCLAHPWISESRASKEHLPLVLEEMRSFNEKRGKCRATEHCLSSVLFRVPHIPLGVSTALSDKKRFDIIREGGVAPLISLVYSQDAHEQLSAVKLFANYARLDCYQKSLLEAGGLRALVKVAQRGIRDGVSEALFFVSLAMLHLADTGHQQLAEEENCFDTIVLMANQKSRLVRGQAARLLSLLCVRDKTYLTRLVRLGVVEPIAQLAASDQTEHQRSALQALAALAEHPEFHEELGRHNVVGVASKIAERSDPSAAASSSSSSSSSSSGGATGSVGVDGKSVLGVQFLAAVLLNLLSLNAAFRPCMVDQSLAGLMLLIKSRQATVKEQAQKAFARLVLNESERLQKCSHQQARVLAAAFLAKFGPKPQPTPPPTTPATPPIGADEVVRTPSTPVPLSGLPLWEPSPPPPPPAQTTTTAAAAATAPRTSPLARPLPPPTSSSTAAAPTTAATTTAPFMLPPTARSSATASSSSAIASSSSAIASSSSAIASSSSAIAPAPSAHAPTRLPSPATPSSSTANTAPLMAPLMRPAASASSTTTAPLMAPPPPSLLLPSSSSPSSSSSSSSSTFLSNSGAPHMPPAPSNTHPHTPHSAARAPAAAAAARTLPVPSLPVPAPPRPTVAAAAPSTTPSNATPSLSPSPTAAASASGLPAPAVPAPVSFPVPAPVSSAVHKRALEADAGIALDGVAAAVGLATTRHTRTKTA